MDAFGTWCLATVSLPATLFPVCHRDAVEWNPLWQKASADALDEHMDDRHGQVCLLLLEQEDGAVLDQYHRRLDAAGRFIVCG